MKIGIFGGSFDPIHLGHTRIINEAIISLQLDKMLIVPTKHNPWKEDSVANNQQRIEMIQIALKDNSKCEVCTLEIDRQDNEKNYNSKMRVLVDSAQAEEFIKAVRNE